MTSKQLQDVFMRVMLITDCHLAHICHKAVCVCAHIALPLVMVGLTYDVQSDYSWFIQLPGTKITIRFQLFTS